MGKILLWLQERVKFWTKPCAGYLAHPPGFVWLTTTLKSDMISS
jgi:hypothetical protein